MKENSKLFKNAQRTLNEFLATSALVSTPSIPPRKRVTPEPEEALSLHPSQTSPYQEREEARRLAKEKGRGGEGEEGGEVEGEDDEEDGEEDAGVAAGAVVGVACPPQAADAKHPACWEPGSVFLGDLAVCTFFNILITICTYNIRQGEPCVLLRDVRPCSRGCALNNGVSSVSSESSRARSVSLTSSCRTIP